MLLGKAHLTVVGWGKSMRAMRLLPVGSGRSRTRETRYLQCQEARVEFLLLAEDVRIVFRKHEAVQVVSRSWRGAKPPTGPPICQLDSDELALLPVQNRALIYQRDSTI